MNGDSTKDTENQFQEITPIKMEKNKFGEVNIGVSHPATCCLGPA